MKERACAREREVVDLVESRTIFLSCKKNMSGSDFSRFPSDTRCLFTTTLIIIDGLSV